jgi:RimJ/RimL family protein N-acetyltransferase
MIETPRLILRRWRAADREPYAAMLADPEVADWLGGVVTRAEADARIDASEAAFERFGFGRFALERRADGQLVGYCGLMRAAEVEPVPPGLEIGWALVRGAWGRGYAAEAAEAVLADGFTSLGLSEILAFTAETNLRSQAVMRRLGMVRTPERDFDHPNLAEDHPLRRHIVFVARPPT